jgi:hypothetical protein
MEVGVNYKYYIQITCLKSMSYLLYLCNQYENKLSKLLESDPIELIKIHVGFGLIGN